MVGMVPAMFQVPMSAPTARRMKIAPIADVTPPTAASATPATEYPFLNAIKLANAALRSSATWSGPLVASIPNRAMVSARSAISTTIGMRASSIVGARGPRSAVALPTSLGGDAVGGLDIGASSALEPHRKGGVRPHRSDV